MVPVRPSVNRRLPLYVAVLLVFGGLCLYGAVGSWLGVAQAIGGPRVPGTVVDVHCGYRSSCGGVFTSDDGTIRDRRVTVIGGTRTQQAHGTYVAKIDNGLNGAIQSNDTVYVGSVDIGIAGPIVIAVLLSLLGLAIMVPFVAVGFLYLRRQLRSR